MVLDLLEIDSAHCFCVTDSDEGNSVCPHDPRTENPAGKSTAETQVSLVFEICVVKCGRVHCLRIISAKYVDYCYCINCIIVSIIVR